MHATLQNLDQQVQCAISLVIRQKKEAGVSTVPQNNLPVPHMLEAGTMSL